MFSILLWPLKLIGSIIGFVFQLVFGIIGGVFGLIGGLLGLIFGGALFILTIIGVVAVIRWFARGVRGI